MKKCFHGTCTPQQLAAFSAVIIAQKSLKNDFIVMPVSKNRRTCHLVFDQAGSIMEPDKIMTINGIRVGIYTKEKVGKVYWISTRYNELTAVRKNGEFILTLKERVPQRCFFRSVLEERVKLVLN